MRATFYATTGPGGARTIADDDLRELIDLGHELGNHGRSHKDFTELGDDELRDELEWGRAEVARFAAPTAIVAPPRGHLNPAVLRALHAAGLAVRAAPILGGRGPACELMPTAQVFPHSRARTISHLVRRGVRPSLPAMVAWTSNRDLWDRLRGLARRAASDSQDLHLWGHSEEIDRLDLWDRLDALLAELAAMGFEPATNGELVARRARR
jgi:peptidoglycan/xylan/chitin deacetylase (PgdA/CDA1 family)